MKKTGKLFALLALAAGTALTGCDKTKDDVKPAKINGALTLNDDAYSTLTGMPVTINVLANDTVAQGGVLTFGTPQHGTVAQIMGTTQYTYTPDSLYTGTDVFNYTVCLNGTCDTATVTVTIGNSTNCQPVAGDDSWNTTNDSPLAALPTVNDQIPCGTPVVSIVAGPAHGTAQMVGPNGPNMIAYSANSGYVGLDQITYQVCVGNYCDTGIITINVTAGTSGCQPTANDDGPITVYSDGQTATFMSMLINDVTPCPNFNVDIVTPAAHGQSFMSSANPKLVSYLPTGSYAGPDQIKYRICNGNNCDEAIISINVQAPTCQIVANNDQVGVTMNTQKVISPLGNDVTCWAPVLQVSVPSTGGPSHGTHTINSSNQIIYNPTPGYTGPDQITYQMIGNGQTSNLATISINVTGTPGCGMVQQAYGDTAFVNTGTFTNINVLANDQICPGGQVVLQVLGQQPAHGSVTVVNVGGVPQFRYYTQAPAGTGDSFQYQITNTVGGVPQTFNSWVGIVIQ